MYIGKSKKKPPISDSEEESDDLGIFCLTVALILVLVYAFAETPSPLLPPLPSLSKKSSKSG